MTLRADIVAYRCAAASENDPVDVAIYRTDEMMRRILHDTNALEYKAFLTGDNNFRYTIYPEYKANRKGKPKPKHLADVQEYLITQWNAKVTDGNEADDELGIEQTCANNSETSQSVICSIDKDLLQIPGKHYNFVKQEFLTISPMEGLRRFYGQLITGDGSDNIPGYDGKIRHSIPKFMDQLLLGLEDFSSPWDLYSYVLSHYGSSALSTLHINAKCLYIQRKENDYWEPPGPMHVNEDSLSQPLEQQLDDGLLNT